MPCLLPEESTMDMISEGAHIARQEAGRIAAAAATPDGAGYLTYRLGAEEYGIDIRRVQEIRSYEQPTRIPGSPPSVKGVVNLRGVIVPIVDLRLHLNCETAEYNDFTVVIVLSVRGRVAGVVVDSVSDVIDLAPEAVKPPPELSTGGLDFITGIGNVGERMLMLVDLERLLADTIGMAVGKA
jgi:purine-binding chemotaxis protein CheW